MIKRGERSGRPWTMRGRVRKVVKAIGRGSGAVQALVKAETMAGRKTGQLSGGQEKRLALARALAPQPTGPLLDEPSSATDDRKKP